MRLFLASSLLLTSAFFSISTQANPSSEAHCALASEGIYQGLWVKHRVFMNQDLVYGANDMNSVLTKLQNLRGQGHCQ